MYSLRMVNARASGDERVDLEERKADIIARVVLGRIVSGVYAVGSVLPREEDLVSEHAASRGVVREAIKLLEVHRLVRPVRRRGTEVLDPMRSLSPEVVRAMLVPRPGQIDRTMLAGLLEVRALLDVELSSLAATRRTDEDLRALDAILAEAKGLLADPDAYVRVTARVPRALARASKNPLFEMLTAWNEIVARDLEPLLAATRPAPSPHLQALVLLVDLVRQRDAAGVRQLISAFHAWATPRLLQAADLLRSGDTFPTSTIDTRSARERATRKPASTAAPGRGPKTLAKRPAKRPAKRTRKDPP